MIEFDKPEPMRRSGFVRRPRIHAQDGDHLLIDLGSLLDAGVARMNPTEPRAGNAARVYNRAARTLSPPSSTWPLGLYLAEKKTSDDELPPGMDEWRWRNWQWQAPTIEPEEAARVEAHAASIVSAERDELHAATDTLGALLGHAAREMIDDGISPVLADLLIERLAAGDYTGALDLCDSRTRAAAIVVLGYALDNNDDLRAVLGRWPSCHAGSGGETGEALLLLFRKAGYVTDIPACAFTEPTVVYRGNLGEDPTLGFSWTLDPERAASFAVYALRSRAALPGLERGDDDQPEPTVWKATVRPDAILGYFTARNGDEVIVEPDKLNEWEIDHWPETEDEADEPAEAA